MSSINDALRRANRPKSDTPAHPMPPLRVARRSKYFLHLWFAVGLTAAMAMSLGWLYWHASAVETPPSGPPAAEPSRTEAPRIKLRKMTRPIEPPLPRASVPDKRLERASLSRSEVVIGSNSSAGGDSTDRIGAVIFGPDRPVQQMVVEDEALLHFRAAESAMDQGDEDQAVESYRQAIAMNPELAEAWLNLGNIFFYQREDSQTAQEMYEHVLSIDPYNKLAQNNIGVIHISQGRFDEAESILLEALKQDPYYVDALYNMACLAARREKFDLAIGYLKSAAQYEPEVIVWAQDDDDLAVLKGNPFFENLVENR